MDIAEAIRVLEDSIEDPRKGLPESVFLFASRITPMVNVDLLIKNEKKETLLTWRNDGFFGAGWHIPGGIVRLKERFSDRIAAVARTELGAEVEFEEKPLALHQLIREQQNRGHFVSLLFACRLVSPPDSRLEYFAGVPKAGEWQWHRRCPENILPVHNIYTGYF